MSRFRFISPFKKVLCPFCYDEFHMSEMEYRDVTDDADETKKEEAPKIAAAFGITDPNVTKVIKECPKASNPLFPFHLRVLTKTPLIRRFIVVKTNGVRFGREKKEYWGCCPHCGLRLPRELTDGDFADKTISIIGLSGSGKSCFLTELIEEIERRAEEVGYDFRVLKTVKLRGAGHEPLKYVDSSTIYKERYADDKDQHIVPGQTVAIDYGNAQVRIPLIYRLVKGNKKVDLYFYDPAGEDLEDVNKFHRDYHYATRASGVLFIIDPFAYAGVRNYCRNRYSAINTRNPIDVLYRLFLDNGKLDEGKITVPCAVVLSKFDLLREEIAELVEEPGVSYNGGYNRKYYDKLHGKINAFLASIKVPLTMNTLGNTLSNFRLFAVSALGGTPVPFINEKGIEREKYPVNPKPFGVVAPLFWLLYEFGFLPESKG